MNGNGDDPDRSPLDGTVQGASRKESGAQGEQRRRRERQDAEARERERSGLTTTLKGRIAEIKKQPIDALGNQTFANNVARVLAEALLDDESLPLEIKAKLVGDQIDRIAATHSKAFNVEHIRKLKKKAGLTDEPASKSNAVVPIGSGRTLRAR